MNEVSVISPQNKISPSSHLCGLESNRNSGSILQGKNPQRYEKIVKCDYEFQ